MNVRRGDVVLVDFPFIVGGGSKVRPALVVQSEANNQRLATTIVAMVSGTTRLAGVAPTQLLIDPTTQEGKSSGLLRPSAVKFENLFSVDKQDVLRRVGHLPASLMAQVDRCLKSSLGL